MAQLPDDGSVMPRLIGPEALRLGQDGRGILLGSRCKTCGQETVPPAPACPVCASQDLETREQPREGTLYSYTVLHVGPSRWRKPLKIGYVDLTNGVRVFAHLTGDDLAIGEVVSLETAIVGQDDDGVALEALAFRPMERAR